VKNRGVCSRVINWEKVAGTKIPTTPPKPMYTTAVCLHKLVKKIGGKILCSCAMLCTTKVSLPSLPQHQVGA
jgi:hypothetical protein